MFITGELRNKGMNGSINYQSAIFHANDLKTASTLLTISSNYR